MNFCSEIMGTKIDCSCVCSDEFEVSNLLESVSTKAMTFQAERFSRTPVFVTLYFSIPIQIKSIVITPYVGQQCARIVHVYTLHSSKLIDSLQASDVTFRAGTVELQGPTVICFRNVHYRTDRNFDDFPILDDRHHVVDLQGKLHHVVAVKVGIMSMYSGSVPSMKSLKVWATPSISCSKDVKEQFLKKWREHNQKHVIPNQMSGDSHTGSTKSVSLHTETSSNAKHSIPKDFLDPITCTRMKNPVLLPSGQTIDRATLDKHILSQTEWGRPPSDPFTGISFTEAYQPVPNVTLKMRLDQQFMTHSDAMSSLGSSEQAVVNGLDEGNQPSSSRIELQNTVKHLICNSSTYFNTDSCQTDHNLKCAKNKSSRVLRIPQTLYNPLRCCKCKTLFSSLTTQYLLPCRHKLCRTCLLATTSLFCPYCAKKYERKNVARTFS